MGLKFIVTNSTVTDHPLFLSCLSLYYKFLFCELNSLSVFNFMHTILGIFIAYIEKVNMSLFVCCETMVMNLVSAFFQLHYQIKTWLLQYTHLTYYTVASDLKSHKY